MILAPPRAQLLRRPWGVGCLLLVAAGCASHASVGRDYAARANLPVAIEYMAAGLRESPGDEELRADLIFVQETFKRDTERVIDGLIENGLFREALDRLVLLDDAAALARGLQIPADDPAALEAQRGRLIEKAVAQLERDLDERSARGVASLSDLDTCRRLETIAGGDGAVSRRCDALLDRFKLYAAVQAARGARGATSELLGAVAAAFARERAQLLEVVPNDHDKLNGRVHLWVGAPITVDTGWFVAERQAYRTFVPRRDAKGQPIYHTVEVKLTAAEREKIRKQREATRKARQAGPKGTKKKKDEKEEPIPTTKKVQKQVFDEVEGEITVYRAVRRVSVPYAVTLENLREGKLPLVLTGALSAESTSAYHEFRGDERARKTPPNGGPEGRHRARPLEDAATLLGRALGELPGRVASDTVARVD